MALTMLVTCGICQEVFDSDLKFTDHFLLVHTSDKLDSEDDKPKISASENNVVNTKYSELFPNACDICGDIKSHPRKLAFHILSHIGAMPYFCTPCSFACISKLRLQQHIYNHGSQKSRNQRYWWFTKSNMHECEECDSCFSVWTDLVLHYSRHIQEKAYKCEECKLYFMEMKDFIIHTHIHKFTTRCELCNIFFDTRPRLLDHVLEHNKSKLFRKFRHIHWNNGLSPVQNPFSVLRVDYFGNSLNRVVWKPDSAILGNVEESLGQSDSMVDLNACYLREGENEEFVEYEASEDVGHLCEVVFREISDADSSLNDFDNIYNKHAKPVSHKGNCREEDVPEEKEYSETINIKVNRKKRILQKKKTEMIVTEEKTSSENSPRKVTDTNINQRVVSFSKCLSPGPDIYEPIAERAIVKNLRIVLEKLPSDVCDWKSFRRYYDRQRKKRSKLKWAKIAEMRKNEVSFVHTSVNTNCHLVTRSGRVVKTTDYIQERTLKQRNTISNKTCENILHIQKDKDINVNSHVSQYQDKCASTENTKILRSGKVVIIQETKEEDVILNNNKNQKCKSTSTEDLHKHSVHKKTNPKFTAPNKKKITHSLELSDSVKERNIKCVNSENSKCSNKILHIISRCEVINHDHNYQINNLNNVVNPFKENSNKIKNQKNKIKFPFMKNLRKRTTTRRRLYQKYDFIKSKARNSIHKHVNKNQSSLSKNRIKTLISKAKSQKVRVNLVRLPNCIYEKHMKTKPIMLSNILPVISSVKSLAPMREISDLQKYYSLLDHSYSDSLPIVLEEHNYCKLRSDDSDSESTISNYSDTLMHI